MPQFTPTEQRLLAVLSDGMFHRRMELLHAIDGENGEYVSRKTLNVHLANIRKKLRGIGQDVDCSHRGYLIGYRHIVLLNRDED